MPLVLLGDIEDALKAQKAVWGSQN